MTFSGPAGAVTTRPNIDLSGTIHHTDTITFYVEATRLDFQLSIGAELNTFSAVVSDGVAGVLQNDFVGFNVQTLGTDFGVSGSGKTSQGMTVPVGVPVEVTFSLQLSVGHLTAGFPPETSVFAADFKHTASFAQGGRVFDLPEGYTVNGFGIVDNRFAIPVPEPTTSLYTFLSIGIATLGRRWRKCCYAESGCA